MKKKTKQGILTFILVILIIALTGILAIVAFQGTIDYFTLKSEKDKSQIEETNKQEEIKQEEIKPWRFDVARNESMKLIPEDADILVCTDLDETLIPDFWDDFALQGGTVYVKGK